MRHLLLYAGAAALALFGGALLYPRIAAKPALPSPLSQVFPASEEYQFEPPKPGSYRLNRFKTAPDGKVLDINGETQNLRDLTRGKLTLVSFVYLTCGDINGCPLALSVLFDLHDTSLQLPGLHEDLQLMTISFDPARDTVEAIESFAYPVIHDREAGQKLNWHVLTTAGMGELQPILDGYGQVVDRSEGEDEISHLLRMYLVDREGVIRNVYGLGLIDPRLLMTDVETLLMEESAS